MIIWNRFIRIWIENIDEPLIELGDGFEPIKCATWCPTNSTLIACTTSTTLKLWDLKTNCLQPAAIHRLNGSSCEKDCSTMAELTVCYFTSCGQSIALGTDDGITFVFALEDMPFSSHFQYNALKEAIMCSVASKQELCKKINQLGLLG